MQGQGIPRRQVQGQGSHWEQRFEQLPEQVSQQMQGRWQGGRLGPTWEQESQFSAGQIVAQAQKTLNVSVDSLSDQS